MNLERLYMSRTEKVTLTNMCMIYDGSRYMVLFYKENGEWMEKLK